MNNGGKISLKYLSTLILTLLFFCITVNSSARYYKIDASWVHQASDTVPQKNIPAPKDTIPVDAALNDTLPFHSDSIHVKTDTIHVPVSKDSLDAPISYHAADSVVLDIPTKNITLYNKANTKYKDIDLDAYNIRMDQSHNLLLATFMLDTTGAMIGRPVMNQNGTKMESDSMVFNMKTQKGITVNSFTQSGELYVHGEKMKKISKDDYYAFHGRFTTCNLDTPHFAFRTNKMKLINKKMAITGPVHPEFEGVPIPIYIPFGYFPISNGRHSGFLAPAFDVSSQYGLGLTGLGYYRVINDNIDVTLKTDLYSYGGYTLYFMPDYRVRYRFNGRVSFIYQDTKTLSSTGQSPYDETKTYNFNWSHTVDSKAHPGQNFSANVHLMSAAFNRLQLTNPTAAYSNKITSSIAYSKTFDDGKYNLTVNANHDQDNNTGLVNLNAPTVSFSAITIYPFAAKEAVGTQKWYEKLGVGLTSNLSGLASWYDSTASFKSILDTFRYGAQNSIPISLALPQLGFLQVTPGIGYQNKIMSRRYDYTWDTATRKIDTTSEKGVFIAHNLSFSLGLSTAIYGTYQHFGKKSRILGLRHTIRPSLGFSYSPDLASAYYKNTQVDTLGHFVNLNRFSGNVYTPGYAPYPFGGITFGIDNNLEMKLRSKTDTSAGANEKIKLIDGFNLNGSYNFLADSFRLSNLVVGFRSTLFKKVNITANANIDPYQHDTLGYRINRYAWQDGSLKLGRLTGYSVALSTSFKSQPKDPKKDEEDRKRLEEGQNTMTIDEQQTELNYIRTHPEQFADFNIAWSLNLSFSFNYSTAFSVNRYVSTINSSLMANGDFNLTEKWKMGFTCIYDIKNLQLQSLTTFLSRDMHCWQLSINVIPVGIYRSFNITISPKSNILRDVKINRTRSFY